jgi:hypothetical protein
MLTLSFHRRNGTLAGEGLSREVPRVFGHAIGLRRHLRVLPSRTRPSLFAGD